MAKLSEKKVAAKKGPIMQKSDLLPNDSLNFGLNFGLNSSLESVNFKVSFRC